ncbi:hypothetical protein KVT40_004128 [Elsinoe batatas]|uniref:tRNA-splicing endonuclease subunit Sen2 n=1 Tax=Elsinoe batatas TaxID=2601811 RepID=A0A8K0L696_9PEZI|nr:hypothetical protein KVT40_004128 [Elsinoe batatas]
MAILDNGRATPVMGNGSAAKATVEPTEAKATTKPRRPPRPNYAKIHAKPLPLEIIPLPAFVPHNPLSLIRILSALVSELISRHSDHPSPLYTGHFSPETRSVHVTDVDHGRALWEMGFFGKGNLSRSELSWLNRELARRKAGAGGTSEEATSKRREERRMFKLERARAEREAIEEQLRREGKLAELRPDTNPASEDVELIDETKQRQIIPSTMPANGTNVEEHTTLDNVEQIENDELERDTKDELEVDAPLVDQEHLQLDLCEALFLAYAVGALQVLSTHSGSVLNPATKPMSTSALLREFARHSIFPPCREDEIRPDNPFLLQYVVYHHYRSLGWVVRPGAKFAADWLLYNRGPVFSHAEFAVMIVPEYPDGQKVPSSDGNNDQWQQIAQKKWWEVHCTNRVQSQVRKTLVLCYVEVPPSIDLNVDDHGVHSENDVGKIFQAYRVREFVMRRWLANRSRD